MSLLRKILRLPPKWYKAVRLLRSTASLRRYELLKQSINTLENSGYEVKNKYLDRKRERMIKAWHIQVIGSMVGLKDYVPKEQQQDFWVSMCLTLTKSNEQEANKLASYFKTYAHPEYLSKGPKEGKGVNLVATEFTKFLLDKDEAPNTAVKQIQSVFVDTDLYLCNEVAKLFHDKNGAEDVREILLRQRPKSKA